LFGATCVLMEPIADHHLCSRQALRGNILPFLRIADSGSERAVIHCWGGNGRTGHVLAAWLVAAPILGGGNHSGGSKWTTTAGGRSRR
jgi:Polymorphic toxin system, DSP-PTPase phosphatase